MPIYPLKEPHWATHTEGHDPAAWDEAKAQVRRLLYEWARLERPGTYAEVARAVTAIPWPDGAFTHNGAQIGTLLGQVSLDELSRQEDRPVLSVLVIGAEAGMPTEGFWRFLSDTLGVQLPEVHTARLDYWVAEFKRACAHYGGRGAESNLP